MFRFIHVTDLHLADRDFANHTVGQQQELLKLLEDIGQKAVDESRHLVITGDFFDHKSPRMVSHALVRRLIGMFLDLKDNGVNTYAIAGNHDLSSGGMSTISKQPLGVIAESGAINLLLEPAVYAFDDLQLQITPYNFDDRAEWDATFFDVPRLPGSDYNLALAHAAFSSGRYAYNFPHIPYDEVDTSNTDMFLWGHIHDDHGIKKVNGTYFINCGSLCRRARDQKRDVYVAKGTIWKENGKVKVKASRDKLDASHWSTVFNEVVEAYEPDNIDTPDIAVDFSQLLSFDDVDFSELLRTIVDNKEVRDRAERYLSNAAR